MRVFGANHVSSARYSDMGKRICGTLTAAWALWNFLKLAVAVNSCLHEDGKAALSLSLFVIANAGSVCKLCAILFVLLFVCIVDCNAIHGYSHHTSFSR